jgi:CRISPR-associated exonuclease Cas4
VLSLHLGSARLNIAGVADLVEFAPDGTAFPVEYKRGKPKLHRADEAHRARPSSTA